MLCTLWYCLDAKGMPHEAQAPLKLVKEMEGGIPVSGQSDSDSSLTSCSCDF